ncbi:hypothetical protein QLQ12_21015 [Actinoplanes sp. NEAU-A12]|uniref:Secreted protein n=1 Tax=Actinoplanes sandaracinus TaxID=3045177 RepID=A0ABT6WN01_9ACTN|nr:hypothetical protein [Actinoplanes sandaracinus]MDI6101098.1 hypothetical protein [Actinoplanes sandaracinus]
MARKMVWTWAAVAAAAVVMVLISVAVVAAWQRPARAPAVPGEVQELLDDVEAVRAAADRAAAEADEARQRAEQAAGARDRAEDRFLEARWEARVATADETHLLVQRAALAAYRRGELSVEQLNGIWQQAGPPAEQLDDGRVRDARRAYERAVAETVQVRDQVHVASVAAEVLVEEARNAEVEAVEAWEAQEAARPTLDKLFEDDGLLFGGELSEPRRP